MTQKVYTLTNTPNSFIFHVDSDNLAIQLIQTHGMSNDTADMLAKTYGDRAWEVCELSKSTNQTWPRFGVALTPNYPYITAEVSYACREYACTIEDVLSRRTRLAFLNKDAAMATIPVIANIMAEELGWSEDVKREQMAAARKYINSYAGRIPDNKESILRGAKYLHVEDLFNAIDTDGSGFLDKTEVGELASVLGIELTEEELSIAFKQMDQNGNDRVDLKEFEIWLSNSQDSILYQRLTQELSLEELKKMGSGTLLG